MRLPKPAGMFAINDNCARKVEFACLSADVKIPGEVGLVGVDNDEVECELCPVPLSSIQVPFEQIGWQAAEALHRLFDGEAPHAECVRLAPLRIVERLSTDPLMVEDPLARKALARMKATMQDWQGVQYLARDLGVSKRSLELRFRKATGETVYQRLQTLRMDEAAHLLTTTSLPVCEISKWVGVKGQNRFGVYFRQATGITPRQYRNQHMAS